MKSKFVWIFIVIILVWTLLPFYSLIITSSATSGTISELYPKGVTLEYYKEIILGSRSGNPIWMYIVNSIIVAVSSTIIVIIIAIPCGYGFSRWKSRVSSTTYLGYFVLRMLPPVALIVPYTIILQYLKFIDTYQGLILVYVAMNLPVGIWLLKGFFDTTPKELEESAWIEGASVSQTFLKVVLPINTNGIAVTGVFVFIYSYIEYIYASILTRSKVVTVPAYIAGFVTPWEIKYQQMLAAALISMIPMAIIFIFAQRYIVKGIVAGAIKQ